MSAFLAFRTAAFSLLRPRAPNIPCLRQLPIRAVHNVPTRPRDKNIPYRIVQLVDPITGKLSEPLPLMTIIESLPDKKLEYVELVSEDPAPIVKIINKKDAFEKRKLAKKKASAVAKKNVQKEVQLTWGAAEGDYAHKVGRVREELEKGHRIDLVFSHKKGQDLPTPEEMQQQVQTTVEMLADVGKEWKPPEYRGKIAAVFLQGTVVSEPVITAEDLLPRKEKLRMKKMARKEKKQEQKINPEVEDLYQN
ncbi:hypothetical protein BDZ94DRAFT_1271719 [Collybia nuda]|uniref:Uncharacterized protein n=1 Tax=Collybia nuda TaxID=64659 RepID=A0A9P5XWB3_9AGAR|nr:hypothetical protein BDZ94DRAFT_1271719 [Collybia nuda]